MWRVSRKKGWADTAVRQWRMCVLVGKRLDNKWGYRTLGIRDIWGISKGYLYGMNSGAVSFHGWYKVGQWRPVTNTPEFLECKARMFPDQGSQWAGRSEGNLSADVLCTSSSPESLSVPLCCLLVRRINTSDDECNHEDLNWGQSDPVRVTSSAGEIENVFSALFPCKRLKKSTRGQCGFEDSTAQRFLTEYPKDSEIMMKVICCTILKIKQFNSFFCCHRDRDGRSLSTSLNCSGWVTRARIILLLQLGVGRREVLNCLGWW